MKSIYTMVGMKFRKAEQFVASLTVGTKLMLEREPTNKHDRNAVKVFVGDRFVAYVKATEAISLASDMDSRGMSKLSAKLTHDGDGWPLAETEN